MTSAVTITALSLPPIPLRAQEASSGEQMAVQQTQARGFWTDPSTKLMWAGKDNGEDVSWKRAMKYCRDLRLAGNDDWQLATLAQLQSIYDPTVESPGLSGAKFYHNVSPSAWHVKGGLFLTGYQWSSIKRPNDRGKPSAYAIYYDFIEGKSNDQPSGWPYRYDGMRALCVRGPQSPTAR